MRNGVKVFSIILCICIAIIGIIYGMIAIKNKDKVVYITDNEFLYDVAIDYLKEKYTLESYDKEKEGFQVFFDYKGFGISQKDNEKYAYMWILEESYYLENGEIKTGSGSSMPYKIKFVNNKVTDFEIPKDGSYYVSSIRDMFPNDIENKILSFNLDDNNLKKKVDEYYSYTNDFWDTYQKQPKVEFCQ